MNFKKLNIVSLAIVTIALNACSSDGDSNNDPATIINHKVYYSDIDASDGNPKLHEYDFSTDEIKIIGASFYDEIDAGYSKFSPIIVNHKDKIYFSASTQATGFELWVYDPKEPEAINENPKMLVELNSGTTDTFPFSFFSHDGNLYFGGRVPGEGFDFYVYDDTEDISASNPKAVIVRPGSSTSEARHFFEYNSKIYFSSRSAAEGKELWVFDPSQADSVGVNPSILTDLNPSGDSSPFYLTKLKGKLYFQARSENEGRELFVYDSNLPVSSSNPSMVVDLELGASESLPQYLVTEGDFLYFFADTSDAGRELRVYNPDLPVSASNPLTFEFISGAGGTSVKEAFYSAAGEIVFSSDFTLGVDNALVVYDPSQALDLSSNPVAYDPNGDVPEDNSPEYIINCGGDKLCFSSYKNNFDQALIIMSSSPGVKTFEIKDSLGGTEATDFVSYQEEI